MVEENVTCVQCNDVCSGDVVSVQGRYYHQYCFTCKNCGIDLLKHGYFFLHNEFYCNEDYHLISGTLCSGCGKVADGDLVSALGALFHVDCFGCTRCGKLFPPGVEITFNGEDYMCENCSQPVATTKPASPPETSNQYESRDRSPPPYHPPTNDPRIDTIDASQAPKIDPPYESPHHSPSPPRRHSPPPYERSPRIESPLRGNISPTRNASPPSPEKPRFPPPYKPVQPRDVTPLTENGDVSRDRRDTPQSNRSEASDSSMSCCAGCGNDIKSGQALLALEKQWHLWCFTCYKCGCLLAGEYMGRDGVPYCEQDYQSEFGVCCAGCGGYITGKVLQAGEKHYHPQCSRCAKCQQMFGEGEEMYLQGSEIWHPDCSEEYQKEQEEEEEKRKAAEEEERQFRPSPRQSSTNATQDILDIDELLSDIKISDYKPADKPQRQPIFNPHINSVKTTVSVNKQQQPPPHNVKSRPTGFRSIRPPGADDPPASPVAAEDDESPPPVPPPPTRSSSTSWKSKYNSGVYSAQPFRKPSETSPVNETPSSRPSSSLYRPVNVPSLETEKEETDHAPSRASNTNEEHCSTQNGLSPEQKAQQAAANYKKGKGVNRLQMRIANKPDVKPANNSPPGDQQVSSGLQRNKRMSYLSDREFFDVFEMGREKFNTLPKWKQEDLKKAAFLF